MHKQLQIEPGDPILPDEKFEGVELVTFSTGSMTHELKTNLLRANQKKIVVKATTPEAVAALHKTF